jgi:hypothetical protein
MFECVGAQVVRHRYREILQAVPNYTIRGPRSVLVEPEANRAAFEVVQTGTITRRLHGTYGTMLPSTERVCVDTVIVADFDRAGLVARVRMYFDLDGIDREPNCDRATR